MVVLMTHKACLLLQQQWLLVQCNRRITTTPRSVMCGIQSPLTAVTTQVMQSGQTFARLPTRSLLHGTRVSTTLHRIRVMCHSLVPVL